MVAEDHPDLLVLDQYANGDCFSDDEKNIIRSIEDCKVLLISNNPEMCKDCVVEWGGNDFLRRPFSPVTLRESIELLLAD